MVAPYRRQVYNRPTGAINFRVGSFRRVVPEIEMEIGYGHSCPPPPDSSPEKAGAWDNEVVSTHRYWRKMDPNDLVAFDRARKKRNDPQLQEKQQG